MGEKLRQETYLPEPDEGDRLARVYDFMQAHEDAGRGRPHVPCFLSGDTPADRVELPVELYRVLRQVVTALQDGLAVSVAPMTATLTTQQAAELLGVSRPTVIRLLNEKQIPFERVNSHRKILLRDLLAYREERRARQYAALEATAVEDDEDIDVALERLKKARREIAKRRSSGTS